MDEVNRLEKQSSMCIVFCLSLVSERSFLGPALEKLSFQWLRIFQCHIHDLISIPGFANKIAIIMERIGHDVVAY